MHIPHQSDSLLISAILMPFDFGYLGGPLFLLLSGFCIHSGAARRAGSGTPARINWTAFWRRRFWRRYPPYLAAMVFSIAAIWLTSAANYDWSVLKQDLATHLLMVHNLFADYAERSGGHYL